MPAQNNEAPAVIAGMNPEKDFLPKTVFGFSLAAQTIAERMRNRIPMNRIAQEISKSLGFDVSRQQMARYSAFSAEWILPAYEYLKACVLKSKVLHLDETFISCQAEKGSRQYMLVFVSETTGCFYSYTNTRSQSVPFKIMKDQFGDGEWLSGGLSDDGDAIVISTDGWYDVEWLKNRDGSYKAKLVGCMVHLRRYFFDIYDAHQNHIDKESEEYLVSGLSLSVKYFAGTVSAAPLRNERNCDKAMISGGVLKK
ncbi:transposase [Succinimonas sp.]|uniref:IS66 family transposase n=1 Tax=Succinimonas sp. TaxID=1936151 RepID=UPI00386C5033